jgi:enoyl-CoA hydratase/carnithine racemase
VLSHIGGNPCAAQVSRVDGVRPFAAAAHASFLAAKLLALRTKRLYSSAGNWRSTMDYSEYQFIKVDTVDRVATVTLNRPDSLNAVNSRVHHELEQLWIDLAADADVNAIILTGAGRAFCAGGDVRGMSAGRLTGEGADAKKSRFDRGPISAANGRRLVENMLDVEQPIIGAINGDAVGLGATLALLCDIIVVSEKARFADTHVKVGIVAGDGGALIWPLLIGPHRAKEFLMRGNFITGAEAGRIGMVNYAVAPEQVLSKARELAQELADGPTLAIRWSKLAVNKWLKDQANLIMDTGLAYEMLTFRTEDHKEAVQAFLEKRKPQYVRPKS